MGAMKDSGIEWIGAIPVEWDVKRLKYCLRTALQYGANESGCDYREDYPRYIRITDIDINNVLKDDGISLEPMIAKPYLLQEGDVLFARSGATVGKTFFYKNDLGLAAFAGYLIRAQVNERVLARYLFYITLGNYYDAWKNMVFSQATIQNIGADKYSQLPVVLPDLQEQSLIVQFLDNRCAQIDDVIADIKKQIELLQQYKKSLITETVTKGLDKTVPTKDSGVEWIGKVGQTWETKRLKYVLDNTPNNIKVGPFGTALSSDDIKYEGFRLYNQRCVLDNNFVEGDSYIDERKYKELVGFKVYEGDLLITTRGTIGKVAIVPKNPPEGVLHPCIIRFVVDSKKLLNEYVKYIFNETEIVSKQLSVKSNATTIEVIYSYSLKDVFLPIAPIEEQKRIVLFLNKKCTQIDSILESKQKQLDVIMEHKKSLIYEYVTGKKRVKEVQ